MKTQLFTSPAPEAMSSASVQLRMTSRSGVLRLPTVKKLVGMSRSWIYAAVAAGTFPKPIRLGQKAVGWLTSEIDDWLANRVASSRALIGRIK